MNGPMKVVIIVLIVATKALKNRFVISAKAMAIYAKIW
jgi:hypothetical protein